MRSFDEIRFVGAAVNIDVSPFEQTLIEVAANESSIRAAIEYLGQLGGGTVKIGRGVCLLAATITLRDGVAVEGTTLGDLTFSTIPDSDWAFEEGNMTLLKGDGTFPAFSHNHIDSPTAPTVQADFANEMLTNASIRGIAFDNFTAAWHIGARNKAGCFGGYYGNCFIKNTTDAAYIMGHSMHFRLGSNQIVRSFRGSPGRLFCTVDQAILQTGNCFIEHQFANPIGDGSGVTAKQRRQAKGFEFIAGEAGGPTSYLNECHGWGFQCNQFMRSPLSVPATFTNGSANIGVPDGTEFIVGMPVRFTTTPPTNFLTNKIYTVRSVLGNSIQLALDRTSAVITAGAGGSATMLTNGMPAMEIRAGNATSRVTNSEFHALDLEGTFEAGLYVDRAGACDFQISQWGSEANNVDLVMRGCLNNKVTSLNTAVTDIDATSDAVLFEGRQNPLDRTGRGDYFHVPLNTFVESISGQGPGRVRIERGFKMAANAPFGFQTFSRSGNHGMSNANFGIVTLTGVSSGQTLTFPAMTAGAGDTGNAGLVSWVINRSTQSWTIALTAPDVFNGVAGKSSFVLPAGQSCLVCSDGIGYGATPPGPLP